MRAIAWVPVLLLGTCASVGATAPADTAAALSARAETSFAHVTLPNGLDVAVHYLPEAPLVHVATAYGAGTACEPDSLGGLAHLVEHLLTESSVRFPDGELDRLTALYAAGWNATTRAAGLVFWEDCLPEFLSRILTVEAGRMTGASFTDAALERERRIVLEERMYREPASPASELSRRCLAESYSGQVFGRPVGGTAEGIARITRDDVVRFASERIRPGNACLVIRGALDPVQVLAMVREAFAGVAGDGRPGRLAPPAPPPARSGGVTFDRSDRTGLYAMLTFRFPVESDEDLLRADLMNTALDTPSGTPHVTVLGSEALFSFYGWMSYTRESMDEAGGPTDPRGAVRSEEDAQWLVQALWNDLHATGGALADSALFAQAKESHLRYLQRGSAGSGDDGDEEALVAVNGGRYLSDEELRAGLAALDRRRFQEFMIRSLTPERAVVGVCHGRDSDRMSRLRLADRVGESLAPIADDPMERLSAAEVDTVLAAYARAPLLPVSEWRLANGVPVYAVAMPGAAEMGVAGVSVLPPLGEERAGKRRGTCRTYTWLVNQGFSQPSNPDHRPIGTPVFPLRLTLRPSLFVWSATGPAERAAEVPGRLARRLQRDDFNQEAWFWLLQNRRLEVGPLRLDAESQANAFRWAALFGEEDPVLGEWVTEPKTLDDMTYGDLQKLHRKVCAAASTALLAVGDFEPDSLRVWLERSFGRRRRYEEPDAPSAPPPAAGRRGRVFSDFQQRDLRLTLSFPPQPAGPDGPFEEAASAVFTRLLRARLQARLRAEQGLTYAVFATTPLAAGCAFPEVETTCLPQQGPAVLKLMLMELAALSASGFSDAEVGRAKLACVAELARSRSDQRSAFAMLQRLVSSRADPLRYQQRLLSITPQRMNELARGCLSPDRCAFSAVGPVLEEDLQAFGF